MIDILEICQIRKSLLALLIVGSLAGLFLSREILEENVHPDEINSQSDIDKAGSKRTIKLRIDLREERKLQESVDEGHQPWRCNPIPVAAVAVGDIVDVTTEIMKYEDCSIRTERSTEAEVVCKGTKHYYVVKLRKLIKPTRDGMWTAMSIQVE